MKWSKIRFIRWEGKIKYVDFFSFQKWLLIGIWGFEWIFVLWEGCFFSRWGPFQMFLNDMEGGGLVDSKGKIGWIYFFSPFCKGLSCLSGGGVEWRRVNFFPLLKGDGRNVYGKKKSIFPFQRGIFLDGMGKGRFGFL